MENRDHEELTANPDPKDPLESRVFLETKDLLEARELRVSLVIKVLRELLCLERLENLENAETRFLREFFKMR